MISRRNFGLFLGIPAILFYLIGKIRNLLFDIGFFKSLEPIIPSIVVGNITVGGTGKTPMIEYIINILGSTKNPVVISRGYGRKTKGFRIVTTSDTPDLCGDEPLQIKKMFPEILVVVCEKRTEAVNRINTMGFNQNKTVLLFDDAFQHRAIKAGFNIVLADYNRLPYNDYLLPWGNLREPLGALHRADAIVITKCTGTPDTTTIKNRLKAGNKPVFFAQTIYGAPYPLFPEVRSVWPTTNIQSVLVVSALAEPAAFNNYGKTLGIEVQVLSYPDHHFFTTNDVALMTGKLHQSGSAKIMITTTKDAVKLRKYAAEFGEMAQFVFVVPIKTEIMFESKQFNNLILHHAH